VRAARELYSGILDRIVDNDYDVFTARARPRPPQGHRRLAVRSSDEPEDSCCVVAAARRRGRVCAWSGSSLRAHRLTLARPTSGAPTVSGSRSSSRRATRPLTLPALLTSLAAQSAPPRGDRGRRRLTPTAPARRTASGARVVRVDGPPPGWLGKPWACHQGATVGVRRPARLPRRRCPCSHPTRSPPWSSAPRRGRAGSSRCSRPRRRTRSEELSAVFNAGAVLGQRPRDRPLADPPAAGRRSARASSPIARLPGGGRPRRGAR
jgi:hypothetical protein